MTYSHKTACRGNSAHKMDHLYDAAVILFGVLYGGYCVGFSTPSLLHGWVNRNFSEGYKLGLWVQCEGMSCQTIIDDAKLVSNVLGSWFYIVQALSLCGFTLASVTILLIILYVALPVLRGLGIIKAMIILLIPSVVSQAAAIGLFIYKAYTKWMDMSYSVWPDCTFGLSTYLILIYTVLCVISIVLLILHHRRLTRTDELGEALINE